MSTPLAADWEQAQALYCKGLPLREICEKTGIPLTAIRKRATRHKWVARKTEVGQAVLHSVQESLATQAVAWIGKIDRFVHTSLDRLDPSSLSLADLETAVNIAEKANRMARANYGLDAKETGGQAAQLGIVIHTSNANAPAYRARVIDVDALPVEAARTDDTAPNDSSSLAPTGE